MLRSINERIKIILNDETRYLVQVGIGVYDDCFRLDPVLQERRLRHVALADVALQHREGQPLPALGFRARDGSAVADMKSARFDASYPLERGNVK